MRDPLHNHNSIPTLEDTGTVMPVAIIGVGGRFPGEASNPENLWDMICKARSALVEIPRDRFNIDAYYHPHHARKGSMNVRRAHFLKGDVSAFDAPFFTISPAEANAMDVQQRMALECAYEAMENAGLRMEDMAGSKTSCYVGSFGNDYSDMIGFGHGNFPQYMSTGTGPAMLSNRVSWFYDLRGPSVSIDTACSGSMVALHLGCQSIRTGEATMSLVGGTSFICLPDTMDSMSGLNFLSPDGKCHTFDHKANGYSRGEGAAFVVLKRLDLAIKDGDVIRAVIRNTGCNQDGNTPGITQPSPESQEALIREVYGKAGLSLSETQYAEAHGTGTPLGDPIEASALARTLGSSRPAGDPLVIGSIKTNIGHLEGASGVAQLTKVVYMLENGCIPPNLWFEKPNPRIPLEKWNLKVPMNLMPWPSTGLRRVSIDSFGYGGTNVHVVVDDAYHFLKQRRLRGRHNTNPNPMTLIAGDHLSGVPKGDLKGVSNEVEAGAESQVNGEQKPFFFDESNLLYFAPLTSFLGDHDSPLPRRLYIWSAHEKAGLQRISTMYSNYIAQTCEKDIKTDPETLLYEVFPWKCFTVASSTEELVRNLKESHAEALRSAAVPKIGFVFTGQGAQWSGMGKELLKYTLFRESFQTADTYLASIGCAWSLLDAIGAYDTSYPEVNSAAVSQPLCTALQVALVDLLRSWGVVPTAVVGHSSGEIAAAYAKGALTREAAWAISYHRGRLSAKITDMASSPKGSMMAVGLSEEACLPYLDLVTEGYATIACVNSPSSVTVSGDMEAVVQLEEILKQDGHFARRLKVDVAYHSAHMRAIEHLYRNALCGIDPIADDGKVTMFSSVLGRATDSWSLGPLYWVSNMLQPVQFNAAVRSLYEYSLQADGQHRSAAPFVDVLLEIGPHSALQGPIRQILNSDPSKTANIGYKSILARGEDAHVTALQAAGFLFQKGYPLNITLVNDDAEFASGTDEAFLVDIPPFPWNKTRKYWIESEESKNHRFAKQPRKDLFGALVLDNVPSEPRWRNLLSLKEVPWIESHKVQGTILYPAAGILVAVIEAARERAGESGLVASYELRDISIEKAVVLSAPDFEIETMISFREPRDGSEWLEFSFYSRKEGWERNSAGLVRINLASSEDCPMAAKAVEVENETQRLRHREIGRRCSKRLNIRQLYKHLAVTGFHFGDIFQNMVHLKKGDFESIGTVRIPDTRSAMPERFEYDHLIHPITLDSLLQIALASATGIDDDIQDTKVPVFIDRLFVSTDIPSQPGSLLDGYSQTKDAGSGDIRANVVASDTHWEKPLLKFEGVKVMSISKAESATNPAEERRLISRIHWQEDVDYLSQSALDKMLEHHTAFQTSDSQILTDLDLAAFIYLKRALIACTPRMSKAFAPHLRKFYQFMQRTYDQVANGTYEYGGDAAWLHTTPDFEEELLHRAATSSTDGAVLCKHGEHLVPILQGDISSLEVLMHDNLLHNWYQSGVNRARNHAQLAMYMDMFAHKHPSAQILEIGAGTGGITHSILEAMGAGHEGEPPRFARYTFTDISPGFFEQAREKLKRWTSYMDFAVLDVEKEPASQGFPEQGFDVVIADNVLHATASIARTLANVKRLLKPGGILVLSEITRCHLVNSMIVGSLKGWWLGQHDGREWIPTLSHAEWNKALVAQGFSGIDISLDDSVENGVFSVLISTAANAESVPPSSREVLIVEPNNPGEEVLSLRDKLFTKLLGDGSRVTTSTLSDTTSIDIEKRSCILLVDCEPTTTSFLASIGPQDWEIVKRLILQSADITWLTRGREIDCESPFSSVVTGFSRSIRMENIAISFVTVDMDPRAAMDTDLNVNLVAKLAGSGSRAGSISDHDWEYVIRDGRVLISRVLLESRVNDMVVGHASRLKVEKAPFRVDGRPVQLTIGRPGQLDTLHFVVDESYAMPISAGSVEIQVKAIGLTTLDGLIATGHIPQAPFGVQCSGVVANVGKEVTHFQPGDRVMVWSTDCFRDSIRVPSSRVQLIPDAVDLTTAASIPFAYSAAYHALVDASRLQKGESILIREAADGISRACIVLAQVLGAEIFATVSSTSERDELIQNYSITEDHIFSSTSFVEGVLRATDMRGVDAIIGSCGSKGRWESVRCLAEDGKLMELRQGEDSINTARTIQLNLSARNFQFWSFDPRILQKDHVRASRIFAGVGGLLRNGVIPSSLSTSIPLPSLEEAFSRVGSQENRQQVVLETSDEESIPILPRGLASIYFDPHSTYVIAGGSGGLGRSLGQWMARCGAKNIVLLSRSGDSKPTTQEFIQRLSNDGVKVKACACDVADPEQVKRMIAACEQEFPPIRGAILSAMVIEDSIFQNMTHERFMRAIKPKVYGSWNLHQYLPKDMDFFTIFSSIGGVGGSRGQANYNAGNTFQDALASYRRAQGLPAITIDVGQILDVGFVSEDSGRVDENLNTFSYLCLREKELLALVQVAITSQLESDHAVPTQLISGAGTGGMMKKNGHDPSVVYWYMDRRFSYLAQVDTQQTQETKADAAVDLEAALSNATSVDKAVEAVVESLTIKLAKSMNVPTDDIDVGRPVSSYGVDSLVAVELRAYIFSEARADVSVFDLMSNIPIGELSRTIVLKSKFVPEELVKGEA